MERARPATPGRPEVGPVPVQAPGDTKPGAQGEAGQRGRGIKRQPVLRVPPRGGVRPWAPTFSRPFKRPSAPGSGRRSADQRAALTTRFLWPSGLCCWGAGDTCADPPLPRARLPVTPAPSPRARVPRPGAVPECLSRGFLPRSPASLQSYFPSRRPEGPCTSIFAE